MKCVNRVLGVVLAITLAFTSPLGYVYASETTLGETTSASSDMNIDQLRSGFVEACAKHGLTVKEDTVDMEVLVQVYASIKSMAQAADISHADEMAAGLCGNFCSESKLNLDTIESGSGDGIGLAQWSFERRIAESEYVRNLEASNPLKRIKGTVYVSITETDESGKKHRVRVEATTSEYETLIGQLPDQLSFLQLELFSNKAVKIEVNPSVLAQIYDVAKNVSYTKQILWSADYATLSSDMKGLVTNCSSFDSSRFFYSDTSYRDYDGPFTIQYVEGENPFLSSSTFSCIRLSDISSSTISVDDKTTTQYTFTALPLTALKNITSISSMDSQPECLSGSPAIWGLFFHRAFERSQPVQNSARYMYAEAVFELLSGKELSSFVPTTLSSEVVKQLYNSGAFDEARLSTFAKLSEVDLSSIIAEANLQNLNQNELESLRQWEDNIEDGGIVATLIKIMRGIATALAIFAVIYGLLLYVCYTFDKVNPLGLSLLTIISLGKFEAAVYDNEATFKFGHMSKDGERKTVSHKDIIILSLLWIFGGVLILTGWLWKLVYSIISVFSRVLK